MNHHILNKLVQDFICANINTDVTYLILKGTPFKNISTLEIVEQIEAKKRSQKKLSTWYNTTNIYYPNKLNIEQTSSEITAAYKSKLINGNTLIDITGGFGVDSYYFSKQFKTIMYCEVNAKLARIVAHNNKQLLANSIKTLHYDGIEYLQQNTEHFDWIYIDPSRRHTIKGKVFFLKDCVPDVPKHLSFLFKHTNNIMVKTSPLLDLSLGIKEFGFVKEIYIIAVNNDVKELLWILNYKPTHNIGIKTANIKKNNTEVFNFTQQEYTPEGVVYNNPLHYLYEPNAAILKSGGFNIITKKYAVYKLQKHSHLYTSEHLITFPGRVFKIESVHNYNKKTIKTLGIKKANITTRNFPESTQQLRKKFKIQDGGTQYLFFTTLSNQNKVIIISKKIDTIM